MLLAKLYALRNATTIDSPLELQSSLQTIHNNYLLLFVQQYISHLSRSICNRNVDQWASQYLS